MYSLFQYCNYYDIVFVSEEPMENGDAFTPVNLTSTKPRFDDIPMEEARSTSDSKSPIQKADVGHPERKRRASDDSSEV